MSPADSVNGKLPADFELGYRFYPARFFSSFSAILLLNHCSVDSFKREFVPDPQRFQSESSGNSD
jgi:hypothetical protein